MTRHMYIVLIMHTQLFYWAAQILQRVFDIPIWISTLHLDDDDDAASTYRVCGYIGKRGVIEKQWNAD